MARVTIYKESHSDSTVVSNCFIDNYMGDANDAQLKVYLYLLRMLNAGQATSVSDIADKFNHTEKDVLRALKYWENKGLLCLDYDSEGLLKGIRLCDMSDAPKAQTSAQAVVPGAAAVSAQTAEPVKTQTPVKPSFVKPNYTPAQLRTFKENANTSELLFVAETYLDRPMTPSEIKTILFITDVLHFSPDLVDHLIQYCVERGKKDFRYIEKVAVNWAEAGITTPEQARAQSSKYDRTVYDIMQQLGKNTEPTAKELEFINRWRKEYGFDSDIIFEACQRTVLATDKHRFEYADSILGSWKKEDVHHKSDILKIDEMYQAKRKNAARAAANKFNRFTQNEYDFDVLERELLSN